MKNTAAIITVGTRDVQIDLEKLSAHNSGGIPLMDNNGKSLARVTGQLINSHYDSLKKELRFPIIEPFIKWLKHNEYLAGLQQIVLVATDQNERQAAFRDADSVEFANVLKKWLAEQLPNISQNEIKVLTVSKNVADLDRQYDAFQKLYNQKPLVQLKGVDSVFVMTQGGIGAINTAVMLHALNNFGASAEVVGVNMKEAAARRQTFSNAFLKDRSRILGEQLIRNHNYSALKLLRISPTITQLAGYAEARLAFDFDAARMEAVQIDNGDLRDDAVDFLTQVEENEWEKIKEVYRNAKVMLEKAQYIDFLIRVFRIVEGAAMYHSLKFLNKSDFEVYKWPEWFSAYLDEPAQAPLKAYLAEKNVDVSRTPNTFVWLKTWAFFDQVDQPFFEKLQRLSTYRNNTIGAHGYSATSRVKIEEALSKVGLNLEEVITRLDAYFKLNDDEFAYSRLQGQLLRWIMQD